MGVCDKVVKEFGYTEDPFEAGYIMPDGKMLDLSGKRIGGSAHRRDRDHREVQNAMESAGTDAMMEFMNTCKAIRFSRFKDATVIDTVHEPSIDQLKQIAKSISYGGDLMAERSDIKGNSICVVEIDNAKPIHIQKFIGKCFK